MNARLSALRAAIGRFAVGCAVLPVILWGAACGLAGIFVLGMQMLGWLMDGKWSPQNALVLVGYLGDDAARWAGYPTTWLGVHKVVSSMPLALTLWLLAAIPAVILTAASDRTKPEKAK